MFISAQRAAPIRVGSNTEITVHVQDLVSLCIVRHVVLHGQWNITKTNVHNAVTFDQDAASKSWPRVAVSTSGSIPPLSIITIRGINNSLAGNDKMNASNITPFIPRKDPTGSSQPAQTVSRDLPASVTEFASHMSAPAGAATIAARLSTKIVRSLTADRKIFFRFGFL